jgi:hypothetical protein
MGVWVFKWQGHARGGAGKALHFDVVGEDVAKISNVMCNYILDVGV